MEHSVNRSFKCHAFAVVAVALSTAALSASAAEWKIELGEDGSSIKFGFLAQMRAETIETADGEDFARELYFRRLRLLFGGSLGPRWSYFFETDSPNLGKGEADGSKGASDVYIQDFLITYKHAQQLHVDMGLLLIPLSHNSQQSAGSLLPSDYGPFSFLNSGPTDSRVGRDYGVQARGYLADNHFEYRAGVFQGERGDDSTNDFRYVGRLVWYPFEADTAFFYAGTTLGKKRILAIGAGLDTQEEYRAWAADVFLDQPLAGGDGLTLQVARISYDGDEIFPELPEQDVTSVEVGYYDGKTRLQPYAAWYDRDFAGALADEQQLEIGCAWYLAGFERVLKLAYGQLRKDEAVDRDRVVLQLQVLHF